MKRTIYLTLEVEGEQAHLAEGDVAQLLEDGALQRALAEARGLAGHHYTIEDVSSGGLTSMRQRIAEQAEEVLTGDVYEAPEEEQRDLVKRNTIMVVTSAGDINEGGTGRAQPYMRMPFDSYYSRSCFGKRIARKV